MQSCDEGDADDGRAGRAGERGGEADGVHEGWEEYPGGGGVSRDWGGAGSAWVPEGRKEEGERGKGGAE